MDALSQVVAVMRTGQPRSFRLAAGGSWGWRYPAVRGAGFHIVLQGACWLRPPGGEPVELTVGDVVLLAHGHGYGLADGPATPLADLCDGEPGPATVHAGPDGAPVTTALLCGQYQLDRARPHPVFEELPPVVHLPSRLDRHPELRAAVDLLAREVDSAEAGAGAAVPALLDVLLLYILRAWFARSACDDAGWAVALHDPGITAALRAVHDEPGHRWTVESLAARAGLSRAAFARRFTTLVGRPPLAYVTWWRMTTAARLLTGTDLPLGAVAARVGYASEFAFAAAFKREYGTAPGRYRRDLLVS